MRKHVARSIAAAAVLAATVGIALPGAAPAATGGCTLSGTANVTPGLKTATQSINYTFTGKFASCQGTGAVKSGTVSASGSGTGSCSGNTTKGTATVHWNNGTTSGISFSTKGTGPYVAVTGKFTSGTFAGSKANAKLLFSTTQPQLCLSTGLTKPNFNGLATVGV